MLSSGNGLMLMILHKLYRVRSWLSALLFIKRQILDWSKFKAFVDNCTSIDYSAFDRLKNIVGKDENAVYWHFLLVPQCFQKSFLLGVIKSPDSVIKSSLGMTQSRFLSNVRIKALDKTKGW